MLRCSFGTNPELMAKGTGPLVTEGSSSIGRAPVSKTGGWGFKSLLPCTIQKTIQTTCANHEEKLE